MISKTIQFNQKETSNFTKILNQRVNNYFKEKKISKNGNWKLYLKTFIMFAVFLTPYFIILTLDMPWWLQLILTVVMGFGMAGVGMNVMHDANHGSYSKNKLINTIFGSSIYILAGNVYNWQVQHNVLHHTYTNVEGHDDDINAGKLMRFNKHSEWYAHTRFQHLYFIFLYGFLTFNWALFSDFVVLRNYLSRDLSYEKKANPTAQWIILVFTKLLYFAIWIAVPMIFMDIAWWKVLIGFLVMHYTAGLILSVIFQLAHVVGGSDMPIVDEDGKLEHSWTVHQLFTTANFSTKSKFLNWCTGGLNHQIEHHIFPNISHVHYTKISKIVKETAKEHDLPYIEYKTMRHAFVSHVKHLKKMGQKPTDKDEE